MPVKGWLVTGDTIEDAAIYAETDEEAKKIFLDLIVNSKTVTDRSEESLNSRYTGYAVQAVRSWGYDRWFELNPEAAKKWAVGHAPTMECIRIRGAYIAAYGRGLMVLKDVESVALYVDEFMAAGGNIDDVEQAAEDAANPVRSMSQEALEEMLRDAAQGVDVSPEKKKDQQH
jgi:hypothetical protein